MMCAVCSQCKLPPKNILWLERDEAPRMAQRQRPSLSVHIKSFALTPDPAPQW